MKQDEFDFVALRDLRIGLYVDLDVGWMAHPFPSSRFKISTERQIEVLKGLGADRIRYVPARSDPMEGAPKTAPSELPPAQATKVRALDANQKAQQLRQQRAEIRAFQQQSLAICERRFTECAQQYRKTADLAGSRPLEAAAHCNSVIQGLTAALHGQDEVAIRLLTESAGDKAALHPVNVTVVALLLGRSMGLPDAELLDLGLAAFVHDIGKMELPERVRRMDDGFSGAEVRVYQEHVAHSVRLARAMGLSPGVVRTIAQHHEMADGSGFPEHLQQEALCAGARILALVNRYDGLCNPLRASTAMTPHEALALIFSQQKTRFDGAALSAFIRMIGVYPPGSVVQLNDERHALVVSVNTSRPLKPRVMVHEPGVPRHEAIILDLEHAPNASIRRSLKPASLPVAALEYLQPRPRICYFFEAAANAASLAASA